MKSELIRREQPPVARGSTGARSGSRLGSPSAVTTPFRGQLDERGGAEHLHSAHWVAIEHPDLAGADIALLCEALDPTSPPSRCRGIARSFTHRTQRSPPATASCARDTSSFA